MKARVSILILVQVAFITLLLLLPLQVTGLKPLAKYYYRVSAENAAGISDPTEALGPLTADDTHGN